MSKNSTFLLNVIHSMEDVTAVYAACVCVCVKDTNTDMHKDLKCSNFYEIILSIAALHEREVCNNFVIHHVVQMMSRSGQFTGRTKGA